MDYHLYSMSPENLLTNMNVAKDVLLAGLEREGLLKGMAKEIGEKYGLVIHKKGWFGSLWERLFGGMKDEKGAEGFRVTMVKIVE